MQRAQKSRRLGHSLFKWEREPHVSHFMGRLPKGGVGPGVRGDARDKALMGVAGSCEVEAPDF